MVNPRMSGLRLARLRLARLIGLLLLFVTAGLLSTAGAATVCLVQVSVSEAALVDGDEAGGAGDAETVAGVTDRERRLKKRLVTAAILGGVVLLLLAVACGYFRLELTTRGFYSGRLQVVSAITSLAVAAAGYFLWRWLV